MDNQKEARVSALRAERQEVQKDLNRALKKDSPGLVDRLEGAVEDIDREILQAQGLIL